ncbi:DUF4351 domain-containing protein [Gloeobacter violaceus]|uniref:Gsr3843 protein n=1 Tax=Gloeobacter violaceus (strain ATCC 29082 / PCC 7421) TaxID=251221 RepID=Q7NEN6_GLOVI|nr:DUF4351 domain-containing protein [Gloeobacter violaceus]BAC91784.1 gsr3843 [Gloeobacter violaceus PCC 7421]
MVFCGWQEAVQQSKFQLLLRLLERKFGPLPQDLRTSLQTITDGDALDRLGLALIDAPDLETFQMLSGENPNERQPQALPQDP